MLYCIHLCSWGWRCVHAVSWGLPLPDDELHGRYFSNVLIGMARTLGTALRPPLDHWTSTKRDPNKYIDVAPKAWRQRAAVGSKASSDSGAVASPGHGGSAFEDVVRQFPADARMVLADCLTEGDDAGSGRQPTLASARLSCKALRMVVDDGLRNLRLNVMPDMPAQGPAPSLSRFPNVTSLTLSISISWEQEDGDDYGDDDVRQFEFRPTKYAYPPALLLEPLQGQPIHSLHCLRSLTLIGQLTRFGSLGKQLQSVFAAGAAARDPGGAGPSTGAGPGSSAPSGAAAPHSSEDGTSGEESGSSEDEHTSDDGSDATESSDTTTSGTAPADPSKAAPACSGGAGAGGAGGGLAAMSLEHLNLGNVRFPRSSVSARDTAKGHRALAALGLRELTLGVELLPGLEAHQGLHRLHAYKIHSRVYPDRLEAAALASLRRIAPVHVGLLGRAWSEKAAAEVLKQLPDTLASVTLEHDNGATLTLGQEDRGQATRKLELISLSSYSAEEAAGILSAWPRGLPPSARITLVRLTGVLHMHTHDMRKLSALLARAERVELAAVRVYAHDVARCLALLHAVPRRVELVVHRQHWRNEVSLRLAVAPAAPGGCYAAGPRDGPAAAAAAARLKLPTLDELLSQAVGLMEVRARAGDPPQEQQQGMQQAGALGRVNGPGAQGRRGGGHEGGQHGTGGQSKTCGDVMERWWQEGNKREATGEGEGAEAGNVLLLSGRGVLALAAHSTEAGEAALEGALEGLSRSRPGDLGHRAYQVLPGGGGVLLQWDEGDVAAAAAEAVRCAAVQLGLEVPEGGVRSVALPHRDLASACKGLYAGVRQVLQSRPLCPEDLVGQLQAMTGLWGDVREQWEWPRCAARPVAIAPEPTAEAEPTVEVEPTAQTEPTAEVPWLTAAATAVGRAAQAAAATAMGLFTVARSGTWRRAAAKRPASAAAAPSGREAAGRQQQRRRTG